jgi:hypothetical protein
MCWLQSPRGPRGLSAGCVTWAVPYALALDHRMHSAVRFCDIGFAIMVLKAPSGPSGSQELRARHTAPGSHGTHPPSHCAARCQPSFLFTAAGLFHPARLDRPLCFAPALQLTRMYLHCMHAHARSADALQFLRSHAPQPAHDDVCFVVWTVWFIHGPMYFRSLRPWLIIQAMTPN